MKDERRGRDDRITAILRDGDPFDGQLPGREHMAVARTRMVAAARQGGPRSGAVPAFLGPGAWQRWAIAAAVLVLASAAIVRFVRQGDDIGSAPAAASLEPRAPASDRRADGVAGRGFQPTIPQPDDVGGNSARVAEPATRLKGRTQAARPRNHVDLRSPTPALAQSLRDTAPAPVAPPDGRRQIVFTTPGGTRLYWTLDTRPGPERPIQREE
jgi:hypothetical protein